MKRYLSIDEKPPVRCYNYLAQPLSVLFAGARNPYCFLMDHFVQLHIQTMTVYPSEALDQKLTFYVSPFPIWEAFDAEIVDDDIQDTEILEQVRQELAQGYYVTMFLNEFYVPQGISYQKQRCDHDYLFFGFDDESGCLHTLSYTENGVYTKHTVSYADFCRAYACRIDPPYDYIRLRCWQDYDAGQSRLATLKPLLSDYIQGRNSFDWFAGEGEPAFGMRIYDALLAFLRRPQEEYDLRGFCALQEHKGLMYDRLRDYLRLPSLAASYEPVKDLALKTKLGVMKFNKTGSAAAKTAVMEHLLNMRELEERLLPQALKRLEENSPR